MKTLLMGLYSFIGSNSQPSQAYAGIQRALNTFLFNTLNHQQITIWGDGEARRGNRYLKDVLFDISKVKKPFAWQSTYSIQDGMAEFLEYLALTCVLPI